MPVGMKWMVTGSLSCAHRHARNGLGVYQKHPTRSVLRREIFIKHQNYKPRCYLISPDVFWWQGGARQQPATITEQDFYRPIRRRCVFRSQVFAANDCEKNIRQLGERDVIKTRNNWKSIALGSIEVVKHQISVVANFEIKWIWIS